MHLHVWKIVSTVEHPSPQEQLAAAKRVFESYLPWVFERDVIVTVRCERCGTEKVYRA